MDLVLLGHRQTTRLLSICSSPSAIPSGVMLSASACVWVFRSLRHLLQQFAVSLLIARSGAWIDTSTKSPRWPCANRQRPSPRRRTLFLCLWNFRHVRPLNCRHFDLRAQRRFPHRQRSRNLDIVAFALEVRMLADLRRNVEDRRGGPWRRPGPPRAAAIRCARPREREFHCLRARHPPLPPKSGTVAGACQIRRILGTSMKPWRPHGRALALRTRHFARAWPSAVARRAHLIARHVQAYLRPADRLPEIDIQNVFQVLALFRLLVALARARRKIARRCCRTRLALLAWPPEKWKPPKSMFDCGPRLCPPPEARP